MNQKTLADGRITSRTLMTVTGVMDAAQVRNSAGSAQRIVSLARPTLSLQGLWCRRGGGSKWPGASSPSEPLATQREESSVRIYPAALTIICALAVAACSGGDDNGAVPQPQTTVVATSTSTPDSVPADPAATDTPDPTATEASPTPEVTSTAVPTPTAPAAQPIELVLADRVRALFAARVAANDAPGADPDDPVLAAVATGDALADLIAETTQRRDDGLAFRAGEQALAAVSVGFVEAGEITATVSVCSIDDGVIYRLDSDEVVNDAVQTNNYQVDLQLVGGVWLTSRVVRLQQWEGVAGCALAPGDFPY
jgi:hypothetical protein